VNKKLLAMAVALMAVAMLATPLFGTAQACGYGGRWKKPEFIPVTATQHPSLPPIPAFDPQTEWNWWITKDGRWVVGRDIGHNFYGDVTIGSETYAFTGSLKISLVVNLATDQGVVCFTNVEWLLKDADVVVGTFKGSMCGKIVVHAYFGMDPLNGFPSPIMSDYDVYGILKGTGMFEGQTLTLRGTKLAGAAPFEYTGFLLIR
jgi:hypothetical protein